LRWSPQHDAVVVPSGASIEGGGQKTAFFRYGGRLLWILLVENRAGTDNRRVAGSVSLALTDANVIVEGRLLGRMKGSWLVTRCRTYYGLSGTASTTPRV